MLRLLEVVIILSIYGCAYSASIDRQQIAMSIAKVICAPDVPTDKASIISACETDDSNLILASYHECAKEVLQLDKLDQPLICYKLMPNPNPNADKMKECIKNKAQKRPDVDFVKLKDKFFTDYLTCMAKVF